MLKKKKIKLKLNEITVIKKYCNTTSCRIPTWYIWNRKKYIIVKREMEFK